MKSKPQEQLEKTTTQIVAALLSNSVFTTNVVASGEEAGYSAEEIEDNVIDMAYRISKKIIKKVEEDYAKKV